MMDDNQVVVPMTEIHAYHLKTATWERIGYANNPRVDGTVLGINNTLYVLGGQCDGVYSTTMETYRVTGSGSVTRTDEHYVLPCTGQPGPLSAASHDKDVMIILWENTGHLFSLDTNRGRFYPVNHRLSSLSGCLVAFNRRAYILGGIDSDNDSDSKGQVVNLVDDTCTSITLPLGLAVHKCVHVSM